MEQKKWTISEMMADYDSLSFEEYIKKYYNQEDSRRRSVDWHYRWTKWMTDYVTPAFAPSRRAEFVKNFGLVDESKFDFDKMSTIHLEIKQFHLFSSDIEQFIGFLAGTGFFKELSLIDWLQSTNWQRKKVTSADHLNRTLVEIAKMVNGENFLRANLTLLDWWRR